MDENQWVRSSVYDALRLMGEKAATNAVINRLVIALRNENASVILRAGEALCSMGKQAATSEIIHRLLEGLQNSRDWMRFCFSETVGTLMKHALTINTAHKLSAEESQKFFQVNSAISSDGINSVEALKRWAQGEGRVWGQIGCLAGLIEGIAITCCSNTIVIYDNDEPKCLELIDIDMVEELMHIFNEQDGNALRSFFRIAFE